jgi:outer membrane protein assembly factor BamA
MNVNSGQERLLYPAKLNKTLGRLASCLLAWGALTLFGTTEAMSQAYTINIQPVDTLASYALKTLDNRKFTDSVQVVSTLSQITSKLRLDGNIFADFHDLRWKGDTVNGFLSAGKKQYLSLRNAGSGKQYSSWRSLQNKAAFTRDLELYLNNGYPFARLYFTEAVFSHDTLRATLEVEKGPQIVFDSLVIREKGKTKASFLQKYLFIATGTPYSEKAFQGIASRMNNSGYLRTSSSPQVEFYADKARVSLAVDELKVNQIDGVIGFLPDQNSETGKLLLTGQVETDLHNLFGTGKHVYLNWQNFNVASQKLDVAYDHPVLLGSPLDFHGAFQQLKQDSSFVTRSAQAGFKLPIGYFLKFGFGVDFRQNSLLAANRISTAEKLVNADSRLNQYQVAITYTQLDDMLLPSKGISSGLTIGVGQKEIVRNSIVDPELYNDVELKSIQTTIEGYLENYLKPAKAVVFAQQVYVGSILNDQVFRNDLFRFGGLRRLRGFNENQFYSQHYGVGVAELRFLFQEESYFVTFADQGIISSEAASWVYAAGVGGGMVLKVNNGIFRLMLAVGGTKGQPMDITQPKVHFGFVNRF